VRVHTVDDLKMGAVEALGWVLAFFLGAALFTGCGASAETVSRYTLEHARCLAAEREIIDDARACVAEGREDCAAVADDAMAAERARCDRELTLIEGAE
jgi:hypothetical protein